MDDILSGFDQALKLLVSGEAEVWQTIARSLLVSGLAVLFGSILGIPLGAIVALRNFRGRRLMIATLNAGMGLPPVVVGLFVYLFLSRSGPFGFLHLLFTPSAMILAQTILAVPLIAALTFSALASLDPAARLTALSLGATGRQATYTMLREARAAIGAAIAAGFGAVISEVGAVMMVGGNIAGYTRVMTTAIVLETNRGNFAIAIALGIILLLLALIINIGLTYAQLGRRPS